MSELTPNQKAAIMGGLWKPTKCAEPHPTGWRTDPFGKDLTQWPTCSCGWDGWKERSRVWVDHEVPAPDMADPRNWVKALEYLQSRSDGYLGFGNGWRLIYNYDWRIDYEVAKSESEPFFTGGNKRTVAEAIIATLVALYDAEEAKANG